MADLQALYQAKLSTPEAAAAMLEDGMVCGNDIALANCYSFFEAVAKRVKAGDLKNITQHMMLETQPLALLSDPEVAQNYRCVSWFSQPNSRKAINAGLADVMPCYYRDMPQLFRKYVHPQVFTAVVSPMDKHGYFSVGSNGSNIEAILESAELVFLEVNPQMPRCLGGPQIHISQVTALWEKDQPLYSLKPGEIDEASRTIGNYIAEEVPNGATLQLGIGGIPDAVGAALQNKKHLGIHTEMFTESMVTLLECGAADNSRKPIHKGKTIATFALGTKRMYDFIDDNPAFVMLPVDYVNDPAVIAQHPNFISVNSAIEVDFYGQVCAESFGTRHISGTGGQSDYVRGATQSPGGKSFIAFTSTAKGASRIKATLAPGANISTSKNDVDCVVTEYGIARLRGRSLSQRAKALISIAHPDFRDELTYAARKQNIII